MSTANFSELPLHDVHLPEAIGAWPLAIGWWITLLFIPMLLWISIWIYKRLTAKTAVKTAKKRLEQLRQDETKSDSEKLTDIAILIRRVAISVAPRAECAGLTGQAWLRYLDKSLKNNDFSQGVGQCLVDMAYRKTPDVAIDISEVIKLTERWLKAQK